MLKRLLLALCVAACGPSETPRPENPPVPDESLLEPRLRPPPPALPSDVLETRDAILNAARAGSLRRLSRFAHSQDGFISNLGGADHFVHWDLMRRTGFDPNRHLVDLFEQPYDVRQVGEETWFIWPDLAARDPEDLQQGRLSFREQARLLDLLGEDGVAALENGDVWPGVRTAISETGTWRYFLHERAIEEQETP